MTPAHSNGAACTESTLRDWSHVIFRTKNIFLESAWRPISRYFWAKHSASVPSKQAGHAPPNKYISHLGCPVSNTGPHHKILLFAVHSQILLIHLTPTRSPSFTPDSSAPGPRFTPFRCPHDRQFGVSASGKAKGPSCSS